MAIGRHVDSDVAEIDWVRVMSMLQNYQIKYKKSRKLRLKTVEKFQGF